MGVVLQKHLDNIAAVLDGFGVDLSIAFEEINISIKDQRDIHLILSRLKVRYAFEQLTDVTAVDYLTYGESDWEVGLDVSKEGFSRGKQDQCSNLTFNNRFEIIYQLLSMENNVRIRVKCKLKNEQIILVDSVSNLWVSADWAEREVYDMFWHIF